jgi:Bacterial capsule synthesis protein PGA_cap
MATWMSGAYLSNGVSSTKVNNEHPGRGASHEENQISKRSHLRSQKFAGIGLVVAALAVTCVSLARGQGAAEGDVALPQTRRDAAKELAMKITEPFTFAAVGDIIVRRPMGQLGDAGFQALTKVMRAADSTYANMEGPIIDELDPNYHGPQAGGPKTIIDDLKAMGIRVMTTANNHTMDGGSEGMFMTNRLLDQAGITRAGSGKDLTEARQAQVGITPKGTIGVVGMYSIDPSSNPAWTRYTDARDKWPGLNPLHVTPYNVVTAEQMASLRKIRDASYAHRSEVTVPVAPAPANESPNELSLFGTRYKVGDKVGSLAYTIDRRDLDGIMRSIRVGKQSSDFMVVAIHAHQNSFSYQAYSHDNSTPDFLIELAHAGAGPADPQARPGSVQAIRHDDLHRRQCGCDPRSANRNEALKGLRRTSGGTCALLLARLGPTRNRLS